MKFNIFNLFSKKEISTIPVTNKNMNELFDNFNNMAYRFESGGKAIARALKGVGETVDIQHEIHRLQKIQNRTKKQRSKNKLQKRIDVYEK
ncbi:hypothetical protein [Paenibacillus donghaensis]|uniref:Uncharacterized protein n=1 Tax=Paenibacillus donghaensis TaxID=414771 RepID=A0A2Z2KQQ9_9BACL|nr:hypothetical protein [Paenibacillus donghaensis]ASA22681.1 hypothetical protein B9T62_18920 [Paenibacillus donghaensis]